MRAARFEVPFRWTDILTQAGTELVEGKCFGWAASLAYYFFLVALSRVAVRRLARRRAAG